MTNFYTNLLAGISMQESLQKAQLTVRDEYPNPYYWAGFVIMDCLDNYSISNEAEEQVPYIEEEKANGQVGVIGNMNVQNQGQKGTRTV